MTFWRKQKPEDKLALIRQEQTGGPDGGDDGRRHQRRPGLGPSRCRAWRWNTGTQAAEGSRGTWSISIRIPTKLLEIIEIGKQSLITRGALTTFSVANDIAKYFAIIPAMLMGVFPQIAPLNIMGLHSPHSAILSAVIFNAVIIVLLIPLALRGVRIHTSAERGRAAPAQSADLRLRRRHRHVHRHQGHRHRHHHRACISPNFATDRHFRASAIFPLFLRRVVLMRGARGGKANLKNENANY